MRRAGKHSLFSSSDAGKSVASRSPLPRGGADGSGYVDELPRSILLDIISRLDGPSVAKLGMTCRRLREETRSGKIWRALAHAQESSGLCRDDLVTQDFTWRHLFAWRRHVLSHCDGGMNRLAVADAQRVLTCDPVEGGGRCYTIHETTQTVHPNLLTWSRRGELLAVAQESADGCEVILAAPPAMMRRRTLARRGARDRRDDGGGDEDSTAAGLFSPGGSTLGGGGGGGGSSVMGAAVGAAVVAARKQKPSAINVLTLPVRNPVFLAFAPCGTRLAMLHACRSRDEIALHSLDLAVALSSLYGAADGRSGAFAPRDMSREACESLSLMRVSKELSFAFGPRSLDALALVDGVGVAKLAPVPPANRLANRAELSDGTPRHVGGHGPHHAKEGQGTLSDPPSTEEEEDPWDAPEGAGVVAGAGAGAGAGPRMAPFVPRDAFFAEDEGDEGEDNEVSSVAENLWWRRSVNAATEGYRAGVETMARGLRWATGGWLGGASRSRRRGRDARGGANVARRRQRAGGDHGDGRAIKRARLTREATAGAPKARNIPARRKVQPGDVVSFRHDALHAIQLDGLSHIVQWIPPRTARAGEAPDPNPDGHWLVPASYPDAMPPSVYLALVPATATPTPDEIRGSPAERAEAARRSMIGLPPVVTLTGPRAASIAADRAAERARDAFAPAALERRVAAELSPPAVYDELHAVVPTLASAAPGGRIVCWSDDEALWARRFDARDGNAGASATAPRAVIELQSCGFGANADPGGGNPVLHHVQAMQWSPSGRRLLLLLAVHVTTAQHVFPMHQWVVWDPPPSWLEDGGGEAERDATDDPDPGTLSRGRWHVPSLAFSQDCLPIFEQYAQTHSLWNPGEDAVAYPTRNEVENVDQVEVQHFPKREAQPAFPSAVRQRDGMPFVMQPVPPAVVVCEGSFVVWSPC